MKKLIVILLITLTGCSHWNPTDKKLAGALFITSALDASQTVDADWDEYYEGNGALGKAPSDTQIIGFAIIGYVLVIFVAEVVEPYRTEILCFALGASAHTVYRNYLLLNDDEIRNETN